MEVKQLEYKVCFKQSDKGRENEGFLFFKKWQLDTQFKKRVVAEVGKQDRRLPQRQDLEERRVEGILEDDPGRERRKNGWGKEKQRSRLQKWKN